jgi:hypothetical protein
MDIPGLPAEEGTLASCSPRFNTGGSRDDFPAIRSTLTTRGWNSGMLVRSMLSAHTASNGALMTTSCLD